MLSFTTDWYVPLSLSLSGVVLFFLLEKLGKGIVLREIIAFYGSFICLAMPVLGYTVYNINDYSARTWLRYMPVAESTYFEFALPAIASFILALCWPINNSRFGDNGPYMRKLIASIKEQLANSNMQKRGIYLLLVGLIAYYISRLLPVSFRFISLLFYFSTFASFLYIYYSPKFKYKVLIIGAFLLFTLINAMKSGMFTVIAYMGMTIFSLLFIGKSIAFWKKLLLFGVGAFFLIVIQNVKPEFRSQTWGKSYEGSKEELFIDLVTEKIKDGDLFSKKAFFWIYFRTNQGYNIGLVMRRIPRSQNFDGGIYLLKGAISSFVPRLIWPDKPEAGGKFNMKYYVGVTIRGWSTNVGPLGEAYGSFGLRGGILYMFLLGIFIRWAYRCVFSISIKIPLIICWLPVLFYQTTYSLETDTLQILNSIIKTAFFLWILYKILPSLFSADLNFNTSPSINKKYHYKLD